MNDIDVTPAVAKVTDQMIIDTLRTNNGKIAFAATLLGISFSVLRHRIRSTPGLQDAVESIREMDLDITETLVDARASAGDLRAMEVKLKAKGKARGYGDEPPPVRDVGARAELRPVMARLSTATLRELIAALEAEEGR